MKHNKKTFWTLDRHHAEGFTLVELIVVIAILAILAGVGIPVYSGYITKTNMTADQALVSEIVQALELGYYTGTNTESGYVVLSPNAAPSVAAGTISTTEIESCIKNAFGDDLSTVTLKHKDWNLEYSESSFSGNETALLAKVDKLTDILGGVITKVPSLVGTSFTAYLNELGVDVSDTDAVADAAVLYVAQNTTNMGTSSQQKFIDYISNLPSSGRTNAEEIAGDLVTIFNGSYVTAAAALYATAEGYCQYEKNLGNSKPLEILNDATDNINTDGISTSNQLQAVVEVFNAFAAVQQEVAFGANADNYNFYDYFDSQAEANSKAYLDVLSTVTGAQKEIADNLGTENCFSGAEISNLLNAYSNGGILILIEKQEDGTLYIPDPFA